MSLYDYEKSKELEALDFSFYSLIMTAFRQADSTNVIKLKNIFPEVYKEFQQRYWAPGGAITKEERERLFGKDKNESDDEVLYFNNLSVGDRFRFTYDPDNALLEKISTDRYIMTEESDRIDHIKFKVGTQDGEVVKVTK